jgi:hypothetical protein
LTFAERLATATEQEASVGDISFKMSAVDPAKPPPLGDAGSQEASSWG